MLRSELKWKRTVKTFVSWNWWGKLNKFSHSQQFCNSYISGCIQPIPTLRQIGELFLVPLKNFCFVWYKLFWNKFKIFYNLAFYNIHLAFYNIHFHIVLNVFVVKKIVLTWSSKNSFQHFVKFCMVRNKSSLGSIEALLKLCLCSWHVDLAALDYGCQNYG